MAMFVLAFLLGFVAGLRSMIALAVVSLAAHAGWLLLDDTPVAFLGAPVTVCAMVMLAGAEMICDILARGDRRKQPMQFVVRLVSGGLCGAALGGSDGTFWGGACGGALGALCGTLAGFDFRAWLVAMLGQDNPAALTENAVAIGVAALVMAGMA